MNSDIPVKVTKYTKTSSLDDQATSSVHQEDVKSEQKLENNEKFYQPERTVHLSPLPKTIGRSELIQFFVRFGEVKKFQLNNNLVMVEYHNSDPVEILISKSDWLPNEQLVFKKGLYKGSSRSLQSRAKKSADKNVSNNSEDPKEDVDPITYENVYKIIENNTKFVDELKGLLSTIELTDAELKKRYNGICSHLNKLLKKIFPDCQTYKFGSTVAGLGFKESDLDIYVNIGTTGVPSEPEESMEGRSDLTPFIFKKVKKVMYAKTSIFAKIVPIPRAKTPIIRFQYLPTNISCDVTFKNSLGIYKSNFLKYCVLYDPRARSLMMLIKYWAKHMGICGVGRFSNYGLMLLIIFYLQQVDILPTLVKLRENCESQFIEGWQVNFNENIILPPSSNNSNIPKLFHDFLLFYATFNFEKRILCLLDGKIYTPEEISARDNLPDYMDTYKYYIRDVMYEDMYKKLLNYDRPICVQDPIELNQNTLAASSQYGRESFQHYCWYSATICNTVSINNYDNLLKILFGTISPSRISRKNRNMRHKFVIFANEEFSLKAGTLSSIEYRPEYFETKNDYILRQWWCIVCNLIKDIFEMVCKLTVYMYLLDPEEKIHELAVISFNPMKQNVKIVFLCYGSKLVWKDRERYNKDYLVEKSALEKEIYTSDIMLERTTNLSTDFIYLNFICTLTPKSCGVQVDLQDEGLAPSKHVFRNFVAFATSIVPKIIKKTLLYMLQHNKTYDQLRSDIRSG